MVSLVVLRRMMEVKSSNKGDRFSIYESLDLFFHNLLLFLYDVSYHKIFI